MNHPLKFVQILRGFAAIAVLVYHAGIYSALYFKTKSFGFEYGTLGVDFFFTLSGFIITYIHLSDIGGKGSVNTFIFKRFIRVFPFYWFTLLAVIALDPPSFPGWKLFLQNLLLFRIPMSAMPLKVAWSLTFEIVFYILFAIAITAGWRLTKIMIGCWLLLIIFAPQIHHTLLQVFVSNLNIEFIFGCLAGYIFILKKPELKPSVFFIGFLIISATLLLCVTWRGFDRFSIIMTTLIGLASAWIILHAALLDKAQLYRSFALPVLVLAGDASYAIYLTHTVYMPYLYRLFNDFIDASSLNNYLMALIVLFIILIAIFIGILIHKFIEKPLLVFLRRQFHLLTTRASLS
ncbi:MAG TPA: acyltransferase [Flavitalea sp.]|nr:acyltransferase [Flavitalea sp.]